MLGSQHIESIGNEVYDSECLKLINEYFYGVRIFPGQDPTHGKFFNFKIVRFESHLFSNSLYWMGYDTISFT